VRLVGHYYANISRCTVHRMSSLIIIIIIIIIIDLLPSNEHFPLQNENIKRNIPSNWAQSPRPLVKQMRVKTNDVPKTNYLTTCFESKFQKAGYFC